MTALKALALRLIRDEEGQDLIEYALLATFVSLVAIAGATLLGTALTADNPRSSRVNTAARRPRAKARSVRSRGWADQTVRSTSDFQPMIQACKTSFAGFSGTSGARSRRARC